MVKPFLPSDLRSLVDLIVRIYASLDTPEERKAAFDYGAEMLKDGKVNRKQAFDSILKTNLSGYNNYIKIKERTLNPLNKDSLRFGKLYLQF